MVEKAQANPAGLMSIGTIAAQNIALVLNLSSEHVGTIERAIKDEITAMSSHFTMAVADVQTAYEIEITKIKSAFTFVKANSTAVVAVVGTAALAGFLIGLFA